MFGKVCLILLPTLLVVIAACDKPLTATDLAVQRMEETRGCTRPYFTHMRDNALLHDMSLADIHFVPHTTELSATGTARLDRMTPLLNAYGGTLRYETFSTDDALIDSRLNHVREYLELAGCNLHKVEVEAIMSGGRGMAAADAIEIKEKGTAKEQDGRPGGFTTVMNPASPQ